VPSLRNEGCERICTVDTSAECKDNHPRLVVPCFRLTLVFNKPFVGFITCADGIVKDLEETPT
jgi:hypothetical protein